MGAQPSSAWLPTSTIHDPPVGFRSLVAATGPRLRTSPGVLAAAATRAIACACATSASRWLEPVRAVATAWLRRCSQQGVGSAGGGDGRSVSVGEIAVLVDEPTRRLAHLHACAAGVLCGVLQHTGRPLRGPLTIAEPRRTATWPVGCWPQPANTPPRPTCIQLSSVAGGISRVLSISQRRYAGSL